MARIVAAIRAMKMLHSVKVKAFSTAVRLRKRAVVASPCRAVKTSKKHTATKKPKKKRKSTTYKKGARKGFLNVSGRRFTIKWKEFKPCMGCHFRVVQTGPLTLTVMQRL